MKTMEGRMATTEIADAYRDVGADGGNGQPPLDMEQAPRHDETQAELATRIGPVVTYAWAQEHYDSMDWTPTA